MAELGLRRPGGGAGPGSESDPSSNADLDTKTARAIRCRTCGNPVSHPDRRVAPHGGASSFVFANPAGRVFEIITVSEVFGVFTLGDPTEEHTWFSGYAWRVIVCAACQAHLGWRFDARAPPPFWGLISSEVSEEPPN